MGHEAWANKGYHSFPLKKDYQERLGVHQQF
jgi:hypothetical protein